MPEPTKLLRLSTMTCLSQPLNQDGSRLVNLWNLIGAIDYSSHIKDQVVSIEYMNIYFGKRIFRCYSAAANASKIAFTNVKAPIKSRGFSFQLSMCIRIGALGTVTIKLFESGSIQTTGVKSIETVDDYIVPFVASVTAKYHELPFDTVSREVSAYEYSTRSKKCVADSLTTIKVCYLQGLALTASITTGSLAGANGLHYLIPQNTLAKKIIHSNGLVYYVQDPASKPIVKYKTTYQQQGFNDYLIFNESCIVCGVSKHPVINSRVRSWKWTEVREASFILLENIASELDVLAEQYLMHRKLLKSIEKSTTPPIQSIKPYKWSLSAYYGLIDYIGTRTQHVLTNYYAYDVVLKRSIEDTMNYINQSKPMNSFAYPMRKSLAIKVPNVNAFANVAAEVFLLYFGQSSRCAIMLIHDKKCFAQYKEGGIDRNDLEMLLSQLGM